MTELTAEARSVAPAADYGGAPTSVSSASGPGTAAKWGGRVMSGLPAALLLLDGVMKLVKPREVVETTVSLGYPESVITPLGVVLIASTMLYVFPRTALLGAILLTGYLGGAVATHVRVGNPLFSHTLFPVYIGALLWGGLCLRDLRLRALLPLRTSSSK